MSPEIHGGETEGDVEIATDLVYAPGPSEILQRVYPAEGHKLSLGCNGVIANECQNVLLSFIKYS